MEGVRRQVSLLLAYGHPNANFYPLTKVFAEAKFVNDRINAQIATTVSLMQLTLSTIPNESVKPAHTKKAAKNLSAILKDLLNGE